MYSALWKDDDMRIPDSNAIMLGVGESKEFSFSYEVRSQFAEAVYISGYSSAGYIQEGLLRGFEDDEFTMEGTLQWIAQKTTEEGTRYVVLEDDKGGVAFWAAPAMVQ